MSTPANSTPWPVYGQLFNVGGAILSSSTLNPITAGLTGLSAKLSKNDAAFVSTTNTPVEVGTDTGYFTLDLTAAEMSYAKLVLAVSATNSNAVTCIQIINPLNLAQFTGRYDVQTVVRFEQLLHDVFILGGGNGSTMTGAALQYLNEDGSTHFQGSVVQNTTSGSVSKPS